MSDDKKPQELIEYLLEKKKYVYSILINEAQWTSKEACCLWYGITPDVLERFKGGKRHIYVLEMQIALLEDLKKKKLPEFMGCYGCVNPIIFIKWAYMLVKKRKKKHIVSLKFINSLSYSLFDYFRNQDSSGVMRSFIKDRTKQDHRLRIEEKTGEILKKLESEGYDHKLLGYKGELEKLINKIFSHSLMCSLIGQVKRESSDKRLSEHIPKYEKSQFDSKAKSAIQEFRTKNQYSAGAFRLWIERAILEEYPRPRGRLKKPPIK